jgi:hypothetical protein
MRFLGTTSRGHLEPHPCLYAVGSGLTFSDGDCDPDTGADPCPTCAHKSH